MAVTTNFSITLMEIGQSGKETTFNDAMETLDAAIPVTLPVAVNQGGTGRATLTDGGVLVGNGTSAITMLSVAASGTVLTGVTGSDPAFSATPTLGIAGTTLGTLAVTGNTSGTITIKPQAAAGTYNFNLPTSAGSSGQALLSGGGGSSPHTYGTLGPTVGGTGLTSFAVGDLLYADSTTSLAKLADVATGQVLVSGGVSTAPAWSGSPTLSGTVTAAAFVTSGITGGLVVGVGDEVGIVSISANSAQSMYFAAHSTDNDRALFRFRKSRGTFASKTVVNTADFLGGFYFYGYNANNAYTASVGIDAQATGTVSGSNVPGDLVFYTALTGNATESLRIDRNKLISFGGTTSSFPALKRSSAVLQVRLADDSAFAALSSSTHLLNGSSSGVITLQPAAAAGTWTWTLPTTDGNAGDALQTDGSGVTQWTAPKNVATLTDAATVTLNVGTDGRPYLGTLASLSQTTDFANPTGTPSDGQFVEIRIISSSARALTWGSKFKGSSGLALPTTTSGSSLADYFGFQYLSSADQYHLLASAPGLG